MKNTFFCFLAVVLLLTSCGINKQAKELKALENCKYEIKSADSIFIAGKSLNAFVNNGNIDLTNAPSIAFAMLRKNIPLTGRMNLKIQNPTSQMAGINQFEYLVLFQNTEVAKGFVDQKIIVEPGKEVTVPVAINANIYKLLADDKTLNEILNLFNNSDPNNKSTGLVTLKIKPTLAIGNKLINYPGYITIDKKISREIFL